MTAIAVIVAMLLGVALAVLLDRKFFGRGVVRTLIITPFLVMPAAAALVWATPMLDPNFGLLNYLLEPFGVHHVAWLSTHALGSVIVVMIWQWTPFMTLIILAGLQGQPADTLEAAKVDGAGALATFRELTLPLRDMSGQVGWGVLAWVLGIAFFLPVLWMVLTAFKPEGAAQTWPPRFVFSPTLAE